MVIGLDYDDTFTRDPAAWACFVNMMASRGHKTYIVTWRCEGGEILPVYAEMQYWKVDCEEIVPTSRKAKAKFMAEKGIIVDVWIDDNPSAILYTMEGW